MNSKIIVVLVLCSLLALQITSVEVAIALCCSCVPVFSQQPGLPNPIPVGMRVARGGPRRFPTEYRNTGIAHRQTAGSGQPQATCAAAGRAAVTQCFASNGGFQMQYVVALLSNGTQGQLPRNAEQMLSALCKVQGNIITCVYNAVNGFRNSPPCTAAAEFVPLEQEAVTLITGLQRTCGNGPVPLASPCLRDLNRNMRKCYTNVDLDPELFTPSGDPIKMAGAVIGENKEVAGKFCRVKRELFDCMKEQLDNCPGSLEVMALSGYDHDSLQKGIDVLCHDVDVYVEGLRCFQRVTPQVQSCVNTMVERVTQLTSQQIQKQISHAQFYNRFCQVRIQQMDCDYQAWRNQCEPTTVGLKNEFECNLLPTRCKHDSSLQTRLQRTCAVQRFERQLRSGATSHLSTSGLFMTILTFSLILLL